MGRPKGSRNKPKAAPIKARAKMTAKAKAKAKPPIKAEAPDWLRKAMAVKPTKPKVGRKPNVIKEKFKAKAKARRGKTMAKQPIYDPMEDPDLRASETVTPTLDESLPPKPFKGTKLVEEYEPEPAPLFDEVAAGQPIPYDNAQALIAGTLGGGGDHHALAKQILGRMVEANWLITKGDDGTPAGTAIKARKEAEAKRAKGRKDETNARKEGEDADDRNAKDDKDAKGKDARKGKDDDKPAWRA
jgi:hypothetical protein